MAGEAFCARFFWRQNLLPLVSLFPTLQTAAYPAGSLCATAQKPAGLKHRKLLERPSSFASQQLDSPRAPQAEGSWLNIHGVAFLYGNSNGWNGPMGFLIQASIKKSLNGN